MDPTVLIISIAFLAVTIIVARVTLQHKDFVETEKITKYTRTAVNEDTQGNQIFTIIENPNGRTTRRHQNVPKNITVEIEKYYKNC